MSTKPKTALTCRVCRHSFAHRVDQPDPSSCGAVSCRAVDWGPAEWAGQARMAKARLAAGIDLNDLDRQALARATP